MKVTVPTKINVGGRVVTIQYLEEVISDGKPSFADVDTTAREIRISKSDHKTEREIFESTFHELCHYALRKSGLATVLGAKMEEAIVECLEERLAPLVAFTPTARIKYRDIDFDWDE